MHELSVAQSVFDIVKQHVPPAQAPRVRDVRVAVGELAGVLPESLAFCFEAVVAGTPFSQARLVLERVPARIACSDCGRTFPLEGLSFACATCGSTHVSLAAGRELRVVDVEVLDVDEEPSIQGGKDTPAGHGASAGGPS